VESRAWACDGLNISRGYQNIAVLDISQIAIDLTKKRLGSASENIHWIAGDVTTVNLESSSYDVWHDRAVFHFLTAIEARIAYVRQGAKAVKPGGHVIVSTFGPEGPTKCSGLDVVRYDADSLHQEFWCSLPLARELHGASPHAIWHPPAVSLLSLQG
jgi:SAM-dependent methyltransferase